MRKNIYTGVAITTPSLYVLLLPEEPTRPVIYDARGREVTGVAGPFLEGYDLTLTCQVSGGKPPLCFALSLPIAPSRIRHRYSLKLRHARTHR